MEKTIATHPVFLPGKSHGQRSLADYTPWGHKEWDAIWRLNKQEVGAMRGKNEDILFIACFSGKYFIPKKYEKKKFSVQKFNVQRH